MKDTHKALSVSETTKISRSSQVNDFTVNRQFINSKKYHDKFSFLPFSKQTQESLYQSAMKILNHRQATQFEDLYAIDYRTGFCVASNSSHQVPLHTGFERNDYQKILSYNQALILLHNHPASTRPSFTDIRTLSHERLVKSSLIIGHDGSLQLISLPDKGPNIDKLFEFWYTASKVSGLPTQEAILKSTDQLYDKGVVCFEKF